MSNGAPFLAPEAEVEEGWIDYNGHMNMAYYNVLFDRGADHALAKLGLTPDYVRETGLSFYVAEVHVCYLRELHRGDRVVASFQLLDFEERKLHVYHELRHRDGWLAATSETLYLHIDSSGPRVSPMPEAMLQNVKDLHLSHQSLPFPERAGRQIKINQK